jgi:hypothetical protein
MRLTIAAPRERSLADPKSVRVTKRPRARVVAQYYVSGLEHDLSCSHSKLTINGKTYYSRLTAKLSRNPLITIGLAEK